jgi:hypothetical protein
MFCLNKLQLKRVRKNVQIPVVFYWLTSLTVTGLLFVFLPFVLKRIYSLESRRRVVLYIYIVTFDTPYSTSYTVITVIRVQDHYSKRM